MKTYNIILKIFVTALMVISMMLASTIASAQDVTPEPLPTEAPTTEPVPTEVVPTEVAPVVVTEAAPVVVTEAAPPVEVVPVVVTPAVLDVSAVRAYFVADNAAPVVGSPFALDLMVMNPSAVGINGLSLQCTLDQVLFMVDPIMAAPVEPVDGQPVPTPIPGIFGINPYVQPLAVDTYTNSATVMLAQTTGVPAFASGKAETFNLRATAAGTFNMNCTATVVDANGLTQAISTFPLTLSIQPAPVVSEAAVPTETAPVEVPTEAAPVEAAPVVNEAAAPAEVAPVEVAPVEPAPVQPTTGSITGRAIANRSVIVTLTGDAGFVQTVTAAPDGSFTFANVPAGIYTITADAAGYLPAQGVVGVMPGNTLTQSTLTLVNGDLNNDNLIDANDTAMLSSTYGRSSANLPPELDVNLDGRIGLSDLRIVSANIGQVGPALWQ